MTAALLAQQRALQAAIVDAHAPAPPLKDAGAGLDVYRHAYRARLAAALVDNHGVLRRALGDDAFAALAAAYVDAVPSHTPSIRWYGDRLADFMADREDVVPHPALVDIARMDWALRGAFDAADGPVADVAALAALPPEAIVRLRLVPHPSVRRVVLQWAIEPAWRALQEHDPDAGGDEPQLAAPERRPHVLLVWRRDLETQWRSLDRGEAELLDVAFGGATFAEVCERAAEGCGGDASRAAQVAACAVQQWLADGLVSAIET